MQWRVESGLPEPGWYVRTMFEKAKPGKKLNEAKTYLEKLRKMQNQLGKHIKIGWKPVQEDELEGGLADPASLVQKFTTTESPAALEFLFMKTSERLETVHAEDRM